MKKVLVSILVILICSISLFAEGVDIKYQSKLCKMEIITSKGIDNKNAADIIRKQILEFCNEKYIYNIEVAIDRGTHTYIIIYSDKYSTKGE